MGRNNRRRLRPNRWGAKSSSAKNLPAPPSVVSVNHGTPIPAPQIPEFDPSVEKPRIDLWLAKVNECAATLQWDETQTIRSALNKLLGKAKEWYQSQECGLRSWERWQALLTKAFPLETEYPVLLAAMLNRRYKLGEDIEEYYYDKMSLLYACEITGQNAVDCVIHGIEDTTISEFATSAYFTDPEDLFSFLEEMTIEEIAVKITRCP